MKAPCVSVVMGVYNGEKHLPEAVDSILGQTFQDWEYVIIDDGSTDGTPAILEEYARRDGRIRVYRNGQNMRLPASLNRALDLAEGRYIVRMDADDISRPDRLERQVAFMQAHPEVDLSACRSLWLRDGAVVPGRDLRRGTPEFVNGLLLFFNPLVHPCVIAKRGPMRALKYGPVYTCTEDLDLWLRMAGCGMTLAVQGEYLLLYRLHGGQVTANTARLQREQYQSCIRPFYAGKLFALSEGDAAFLARSVFFRDRPDIRALAAFLKRVREANACRMKISPRSARYAAFELLLEYRRAGEDIRAVLREVLRLGPGFLAGEFFRRAWAGVEDHRRRKAAVRKFGIQDGRKR